MAHAPSLFRSRQSKAQTERLGTLVENRRRNARRYTAALALHYLATERPRFLFLGLGEPDEQAHRGSYGGYLDALRQADGIIDELVHTLDRMGERGQRTSVFITADHGRAVDFRDHGSDLT